MKILIISHNPISTVNNNGKTMLTLFSSCKKEELCQLYVAPVLPDIEKCDSYFRITDKDVLKSYYQFKVKGREIKSSEIDMSQHTQYENEKDEKLYRNPKNKQPLRLLLRDAMWRWAKWHNKTLIAWIQRQQPTHIFIVPGTSKFIYNIAIKISKKFGLPIISYICDDYYFVKKPTSLLGCIQQKQLKKKIEVLMDKTSHIITICNELKEIYSKHFQCMASTIMTGSSYEIEKEPKIRDEIHNIVYMGNIRCNRFLSLAEIGQMLEAINQEYNTFVQLRIYTIEKDEEILKHFQGISSIQLCGFVSGEEFTKVFQTSDSLLHVEAFDEDSIDLVKHSVSTKIADSLGSGICLFAYGPKQVASMGYLQRNQVAIVCTEQEQLKEKLLQLFFEPNIREETVKRALSLAGRNHNCITVGETVYETIKGI